MLAPRCWPAVVVVVVSWVSFTPTEEFSGKVVGVSDGDTITVLQNRTPIKVRLHGIDCPEIGQDFGSRAKAFASEIVFGQVVKVMPRETDRYGRTVADVILVDGRILNHQLVRAGLTGQRCPGEPAPRPGELEAGHACKSLPKPSVRSGRPGSEGSNMSKSPSGRKRVTRASSPTGENEIPPTPAARSTKPKPVEAGGVPASLRPGGDGWRPSSEAIAFHAYYLWQARGQPVGTDWDDWLEAERQLAASA